MTSLKTMMAALLAGSLVATAGGFAYAKTDGFAFDPAQMQQRLEKRVDKALTDAGNVLNVEQRQAFFKNWNNRSSRGSNGLAR